MMVQLRKDRVNQNSRRTYGISAEEERDKSPHLVSIISRFPLPVIFDAEVYRLSRILLPALKTISMAVLIPARSY